MRWKLVPVAVCALGLSAAAACNYVSKDDMELMWDGGSYTEGGSPHQVTGMRPYVVRIAGAVCQLESRYNTEHPTNLLDETKRQCPGGPETQPPPPYPPKP